MRVAGIDPGVSGAIAFYDTHVDALHITDMPVLSVALKSGKNRNHIDSAALSDLLRSAEPKVVVVEEVHGMRRDGSTQAFQFGRSFGAIEGIVGTLRIPLVRVRPQEWMKKMKVPSGKDGHRAFAMEMFPREAELFRPVVKGSGRADAALIAAWYVKHGGEQP